MCPFKPLSYAHLIHTLSYAHHIKRTFGFMCIAPLLNFGATCSFNKTLSYSYHKALEWCVQLKKKPCFMCTLYPIHTTLSYAHLTFPFFLDAHHKKTLDKNFCKNFGATCLLAKFFYCCNMHIALNFFVCVICFGNIVYHT